MLFSLGRTWTEIGGEFQSSTFSFLGEAKWMVGANDILQNVGSMLGADCKIPCIMSNRQLFPKLGLHLEANKNVVFHKKQLIFGI